MEDFSMLTGFKQREKISVDYFDTETLAVRNMEMFIDGYKVGLVSLMLKEF